MPEGPEIYRAAARIADAVLGQRVQVRFYLERLKEFEPMLDGLRVDAVRAKGKAMLISFENGWTLYSHNQLYGVWYVRKSAPKTNRQLRVSLQGPTKTARLYSASDIFVLSPEELASWPFLQKLGLDVLDPEVSVSEVLARYRDPKFQKRRLTALLLDQGFLAGMGNYLRSEILFVAKVPPSYRPCDCSEQQLAALAQASLDLPRRSVETKGVINDPEQVKALKAKGLSRYAYRFYVFTRAGKPCYTCGSAILKIEAGGRRLYYCPVCQTEET